MILYLVMHCVSLKYQVLGYGHAPLITTVQGRSPPKLNSNVYKDPTQSYYFTSNKICSFKIKLNRKQCHYGMLLDYHENAHEPIEKQFLELSFGVINLNVPLRFPCMRGYLCLLEMS